MAVLVRIIGDDDGSDEYGAAKRLKKIIEESVPQTAMGEVVLFPSATLYGQAVKDVDIFMIGELKNYSAKAKFNHGDDFQEDIVYLESFCTAIEVKSHGISGIRREGTNIQVYYSNTGWHNATKQSNDQKTSAMNFFNNALGDSPYITNLLWFVEVSEQELDNLLSVGSNVMPSNAIPSTFDFSTVLQKVKKAVVFSTSWISKHFLDLIKKGLAKTGIAVIFQGIGYNADKPLLYYSKKIALERGYDVKVVEYSGIDKGSLDR